MNLSKKPSERALEVAYDAIKAKILNNEYGPNSQVLQEEIAEDLGLSRTPIREAIVRLERDGLVQIVPRHGIKVLAMEAADIREIYDILSTLEPKAVELLAAKKPSEDEIRPLLAACDRMEQALETDDRAEWADADAAFHNSLAELCGNRRLHATIMGFWEQSHRSRMFTLMLRPKPIESTREHRAVLKAVLAGDVEKAGRIYKKHRERSQKVILDLIEENRLKRL